MPKDHEIFLDYLTRTFGQEDAILAHQPSHGGPPVHVFVYDDVPENGMITGVTFGLSSYEHPEWRLARPEMIISVESSDRSWPFVAAYFAAEFRGEKRFRWGDVFTVDSAFANDTQMDGVLVFASSILEPENASVELNRYKVHLSQFYPIYRSELVLYEQLGLERFWKHPGFDIYNVGRKPMTAS